ncbi:hypothetical protein BV911_18135 [Pseudoruegeria sp. SK021]|nr:hypothetical protein BV911_18135 [Pseudoruegeria sp. SK021]
MQLSTEAGWNQTADDWQLFLRHGKVFGILEDGALSATAAIMPYGTEIAWVSMVLTRKSRRGCGFGTRLLKHCLSAIETEGRTALLDATPAGEIIYRRLGFEGHEAFTRWVGTGGGQPRGDVAAPDIAAAISAANRAFGANRTDLLANFASRRPDLCHYEPNTGLCVFGREGRLATQIGPVVGTAPSPDSPEAEAQLATLIGEITGPVLLDVADRCTRIGERLELLGFDRQRPFLRMKRGPWLPPENGSTVTAIAGPEFG